MKRFAVFAAAAAIAAATAGVADSGNFSPTVCGGKQVVNVTYTLTNDADSGFYGNWAIDTLTRSLKVFAVGDGTYCATVNDTGSFVTTGPLSPQNGAPLAAGIKGVVNGGYYTNKISGVFGGSPYKTNGNLGTFDANGPHPSWLSYFSSLTGSNDFADWGWTYHTAKNGDWTNANGNSSGDITS